MTRLAAVRVMQVPDGTLGALPMVEIDGEPVVNVTDLSIGYEGGSVVVCRLRFLPESVSAQLGEAWLRCANCGGEVAVEKA